MNRFTILITLIFSSLSGSYLFSQENLPLKFSNGEDKFSILNWVENNQPNNQIFNYRLPPYVIGDTIYTFLNYNLPSSSGVCGVDIKKINRHDGSIYWHYQKVNYKFLERTALSNYKFSDNKLNLTLFKEVPDEFSPQNTNWSDFVPMDISLDVNNGSVIDSNIVKYPNTNVKSYISPISNSNKIDMESCVSRLGDMYRYLRFSYPFILINYDLNLEGQIIKTDTLDASVKYNYDEIKILPFGDSLMGQILISGSNNWVNREVRYKLLDINLKTLVDIDLAQHITDSTKTINLLTYYNDYFILVTGYEDFVLRTNSLNYYMFDKFGKFVDKASYTLRDGIDNGIVYGWFYPVVDPVNKRILITRTRQDKLSESTYFDIFISDQDSVKLISHSYVEGTKDHFRVVQGVVLDNGDLLLYIHQFANHDPSAPRWYSWIMLDGQKMNIISSTKNEVSHNHLKLYPNPTSSFITINGLDGEADIIVRSINGQMLYKSKTLESRLDITELKAGIYIVEIAYQNIKEWHKVVKLD